VTIRVRLTVLYGLLFLAVGAGLLAVNYALLHHNLPAQHTSQVSAQVVILRAQKVLTNPTLTAEDRALLRQVIDANPRDAAQIASKLPTPLAKPLLAELPSDVRAHALSALLRQSFVVLGISVVFAFALGWIVASRILRPLHTITETARQLSASTLHQRIALARPDDELKRLADTFDDMLDRLDVAFSSQERFVADASHELRTPLTIMRTELDVTLRRANPTNEELVRMATVLSDTVDRSDVLVSSLLALATSNHGLETVERVDLTEIVCQVVARRSAQAAQRHVDINTRTDGTTLDGDPGLIDRLVDNLVDNSIRYNVERGWMRVETSAGDDEVQLTVANTMTPIAADELATIFEPFHRLKRHHDTGHGLGLAIVRSIATAHHGQVTAEQVVPGELTITVTLPRRQEALVRPQSATPQT